MSAHLDDPSNDFDYHDCIVTRAFVESPEYSNHDYSKIKDLTWYTHIVDLHELPDDPDADIIAYDHEMLDVPVRFEKEIKENTIETVDGPVHPDGPVDPWTKLDREDGMPTELFERCLENLISNTQEHSGISTVDYFEGKVKKKALSLLEEPSWQHREDEIFCRVIEEFAEITDPNAVEKYKFPSQRPTTPEWLEEHPENVDHRDFDMKIHAERIESMQESIDEFSQKTEMPKMP